MMFKNLAWALILLATSLSSVARSQETTSATPHAEYSKLPLTFEVNQGQADRSVKFLSRGPGYSAFLTADGMALSLPTTTKGSASSHPRTSRSTLQFALVNANQHSSVTGEDLQPGRANYFIGNNPGMWHTNVPTYAQVRYKNVYPGVDLVYYSRGRQLEYDFEIHPGADPNRIEFALRGASHLSLDSQHNLLVRVGDQQVMLKTPIVYQTVNSQKVAVEGGYDLKDASHIAFRLAHYDSGKTLVIDPVLIYSTYLGGTGNDNATSIAVDAAGNAYVAGFTDSADFPLTTGSLSAGAPHIFVAKLDSTGSNLVYVDYIGGNSQDFGYALGLDNANEVYVTGSTASSDFPVRNAYQGTYPGGFNAFLTKISADGSSLLYSTYLGGNGSDVPSSLTVDRSGDILIAGNTSSTNFPVFNAFQSTVAANQGGMYGNYGFVTKFSPSGTSLVYSSYLGGSANVPYNCGGTPCWAQPASTITGMAVDGFGNAYAVGTTNTYDFPVTQGAYQSTDSTQLNGTVGFVSKINSTGAIQYSTYFYESSGLLTNPTGIAVDASGAAYVTGLALSDGTFPITTTTICDPSAYAWACSYGFVSKFDSTGSSLLYSTFLGPNNYASPTSILLDANNDAYIAATTSSNSFATVSPIQTFSGGNDTLLVELDPTGNSQLWATYLGGSLNDSAVAMTADSTGNLYVAGTTNSTDFPTTQGAFQDNLNGNLDSFLVKIGTTSAASLVINPASLQFGAQAIGTASPAQTVVVRNIGDRALSISSAAVNGDFSQTNDCGSSIPAAGNCSFVVTFTPSAAGQRTGTVTLQDDALGSPHTISLSGDGSGPSVNFAPTSLTFPATAVGNTSAAQSVSVINNGNQILNLSSIQVSGDFHQTNNCPMSLPAAGSCSVIISFIPSATGMRSGSLSATDDAWGSPQMLSLTGTGADNSHGIAALNPSNLSFGATSVGTVSAAQTLTLTNTGTVALHISSVQVNGDYSQTNNCGATLAAGANCLINVSFKPTVSGSRNGVITINDDAGVSPQTASLTGTGVDFSLSGTPTSATVKSGSGTTYQVTVSSMGGVFSAAVKLSCGSLPTSATCSMSPTSVTPGGSSASSVITISTAARTSAAVLSRGSLAYGLWLQFPGIALFGTIITLPNGKKRKLRILVVIFAVLCLLAMTGCAGGTGIVASGGTPSGTYTITVTGTSGSLQHSIPLTLVVQ